MFKCIIEYQASYLITRLSDPYIPIEGREQDIHFPAIDKLDYNNYLVTVNKLPNIVQYQFTLADGANCGSKGSGDNWTSLKIS